MSNRNCFELPVKMIIVCDYRRSSFKPLADANIDSDKPLASLSRSDLVPWPSTDVPAALANVCFEGAERKWRRLATMSQFHPRPTLVRDVEPM